MTTQKASPERVLTLWQEGLRAAEIARQVGVSRERIRQILGRFEITPQHRRESDQAVQRAAKLAALQERRERENARCAECGAVLISKPNPNGNPSWCSGMDAPIECRRAGARWRARERYHTNPKQVAYRATYQAAYLKTERGMQSVKAAAARYQATHREAIAARARQKRAANPEPFREATRRYYQEHRDELLAKRRARYAAKKAAQAQP